MESHMDGTDSRAALVGELVALPPDIRALQTQSEETDLLVEIGDDRTFVAVAEQLEADRAMDDRIVALFEKPKADAARTHRGICALERQLRARLLARIGVEDRALCAYREGQERTAAVEASAAALEAAGRDATRRAAEAAALEEMAEATGNAALRAEAERVRTAPAAPPGPHVRVPDTLTGRIGFGPRRWYATVTSLPALVEAVARPTVLRALLVVLKGIQTSGHSLDDAILYLTEQLADSPTVPVAALTANERFLSQMATQNRGALALPGVSVTSTLRTKRQPARASAGVDPRLLL